MKHRLAVLLLFSVASFSCKKSDDNSGGSTGTADRVWKVGTASGGTEYQVNNYAQSGETYTAYDINGNSISFSFASYPPAAGNYRVIADTAALGAGQVKVYVASFATSADTYRASGTDGVSALVSFESGRIKIVLPETRAGRNSGSSDSLRISATLSPLL